MGDEETESKDFHNMNRSFAKEVFEEIIFFLVIHRAARARIIFIIISSFNEIII